MKKILITLIGIFPLLAIAQQLKNFSLQVAVTGLPDQTKIYLFYGTGKEFTKDSALVKKGIGEFTGSISQPCATVVRTEKDGKITDIVHFYLEPGTKTILKGNDSLHNATVPNSIINEDYYALQKISQPYFTQMMAIRAEAPKIPKEERTGEKATALNKKYRLLQDTLRELQTQFIRTHPNSFIALEALKAHAGTAIKVAEIAPLFNNLSKEIRETPLGQSFALDIAKAGSISEGKHAPLFTSFTPAGDTLRLQEVIGKSKLVLLDFWASWCGPCRAENPNVVKAYQKYHDKGFNILSISLDDKPASWKAAILKDNMPWFQASSLMGWKDSAAVLYSVSTIPDNFLLDANGKIIARGLRGPALEEKLKEYLIQ